MLALLCLAATASSALADSVGPASFPKDTYFLSSVACRGATCEAVGEYKEDAGAVVVRFVNGRAVQETVLPNITFGLSGVACPASGLCYAVGENGLGGVVVRIAGGVPGTTVQVPDTASVTAISCGSAAVCVGVSGSRITDFTDGAPGASYFVPGEASYQSVSCPTTSSCIAVGYLQSLAGVWLPITNGVPGSGPKAIPGAWSMLGVACPSGASCLAVGAVASATSGIATISHGSASHAHRVAGTGLSGVTCQSASRCEAVGNTTELPIIGGKAAAPAAAHGVLRLYGVACYSASHCLTVGLGTRSGRQVGVAATITLKTPSVHKKKKKKKKKKKR
jgi:hypothetical protein